MNLVVDMGERDYLNDGNAINDSGHIAGSGRLLDGARAVFLIDSC